MPIHPFYGMELQLLRTIYGKNRRSFVSVLGPNGGIYQIPFEWTNKALAIATPCIGGQELKVDAKRLLLLARACAVAKSDKAKDSQVSETDNVPAREDDDNNLGKTIRRKKKDFHRHFSNDAPRRVGQQQKGGGDQ